jgi:hypothetical protein
MGTAHGNKGDAWEPAKTRATEKMPTKETSFAGIERAWLPKQHEYGHWEERLNLV